jgi:hypothetical protein
MSRVSFSAEVLESDLADIYRLLYEKELARAASTNAPSVAPATSDRADERSEWKVKRAQVWSNVMPQSRDMLRYLVDHQHRENTPIGFQALQTEAGISTLGGAIKSIHHWTKDAGLHEYSLFRARIVNGATVYWVDDDVADFLRTLP